MNGMPAPKTRFQIRVEVEFLFANGWVQVDGNRWTHEFLGCGEYSRAEALRITNQAN